jgi:hypothetical protein
MLMTPPQSTSVRGILPDTVMAWCSRSLTERVIDDPGLASSENFINQMGWSVPDRGDEPASV